MSRKDRLSRRRKLAQKNAIENKSFGEKMAQKLRLRFAPKEGLFWLLAGFPVFLMLRLAGQFASGDIENIQKYVIWAALMATTFALLSTFTKVLSK